MGLQRLQHYGLLVEVVRNIVTCSEQTTDIAVIKSAHELRLSEEVDVIVMKYETLIKLKLVLLLLALCRGSNCSQCIKKSSRDQRRDLSNSNI